MITVRLPEKLEERLIAMCAETRRSKNFLAVEALEYFLDDLEDVIKDRNDPDPKYITTEELKRNLGLDECTK